MEQVSRYGKYRVENLDTEELLRIYDTSTYEKTILGSLIVNESLYRDISDMILPEMFSTENLLIAKSFFSLLAIGEPLRKIKIMRWYSDNGYTIDKYSLSYFEGLMTEYSEDEFLESAIKLRKLYELKENILAASNFLQNAANVEKDPSIILDSFKKQVFEINETIENTTENLTFSQQVDKTFQDIEDRMKGEKMVGITTGFKSIDEVYGGWDFGNLGIIAAAPGMGKTTLALQFTLAALKSGITSKVFSLEMSYTGLIEKLASMETAINSNNIHMGRLMPHEKTKLFNETKAYIKALPLSIWESKKQKDRSIENVEREIRISAKRDNAKFFFIDYLGLMQTSGKKFSKTDEYEEIANSLKTVAKDLNIVIILLAQTSRSAQAIRQRPKVTDIKYGAEGATDFVISPYIDMTEDDLVEARKTKYVPVDICFTRHRLSGILRDFKMIFHTDSNSYTEYDNGLGLEEGGSNNFVKASDNIILRGQYNDDFKDENGNDLF